MVSGIKLYTILCDLSRLLEYELHETGSEIEAYRPGGAMHVPITAAGKTTRNDRWNRWLPHMGKAAREVGTQDHSWLMGTGVANALSPIGHGQDPRKKLGLDPNTFIHAVVWSNDGAMNRPFAMVELIDLVQSPYTTTSAGGENTTTKYTINFVSSIKLLNNTKQTFNLTAYIHSVASLAGCGACGDASKSPTVCKTCKVYYTIISRIPVVFRRLLYSVDSDVVQVNTSIVIIDDQTQAKTAENNINPTTMNSRLRSLSNNIESVAINQLNVFQESVVSPQPPPNPGALTTTTPPPIVIPTNGDSSGIGAIIGGAVGGIAGVALIGTVVWFTTSGNKPPKPATPLKAGFQTRHRLVYRQAGNGGISSRPTSTPKFAYMLKTQHS
jgi:hypothetical protein